MSMGPTTATPAPGFRQQLEATLGTRPFGTSAGVVQQATRRVQFGNPGGYHEETECWVYRRNNANREMLFAFYNNFTPNDLICKVIGLGEEITRGEGASIQFNADRSFLPCAGGHFGLQHSGSVTVRHAISREDLLQAMQEAAPETLSQLGTIDWPFLLGTTADVSDLLDRLFLYTFAVEEAKRFLRGE